MATLSEGYMKYDIFHIVFCVVLFSIIFQGSLLPKVAEKCDMIDNSTDVMRTFSDYTGDMQIQFVQLPIGDNHPWKNRKICEIEMLPGMLITVIRRGAQTIVSQRTDCNSGRGYRRLGCRGLYGQPGNPFKKRF